ncbi:MAG TPA: hypothetical protein VJC03_07190 [bacterium]|nr:hypothetical protein [bacterium]
MIQKNASPEKRIKRRKKETMMKEAVNKEEFSGRFQLISLSRRASSSGLRSLSLCRPG